MNNVKVVQTLFDRMSAFDIEGTIELLSDDVVVTWPYQVEGRPPHRPPRVIGAEFRQAFRAVGDRYSRMAFVDVVIHGTPSSDVVVAEYLGDITTAEGRSYRNTYISVFEMSDGLITQWREYFNPMILAAAFAPRPDE